MSPGLPCLIRVRPASTSTSSVRVAKNSSSFRLHRANSGTRPSASILESPNAWQDSAGRGLLSCRLSQAPLSWLWDAFDRQTHQVFGSSRGWACEFQNPRAVLKTAGLASKDVHRRPRKFKRRHRQSTVVRLRPQLSSGAAVILAVTRSRDMANVASPSFGAASLEQLRDTLMGKSQHPPSVTHREVGSLN